MKNTIISASYIIESGEFSVGKEELSDFKWLGYVIDPHSGGVSNIGDDWREKVEKHFEDLFVNNMDGYLEENYDKEKEKEKFIKLIEENYDEYNCMIYLSDWCVEYDDNVSVLILRNAM